MNSIYPLKTIFIFKLLVIAIFLPSPAQAAAAAAAGEDSIDEAKRGMPLTLREAVKTCQNQPLAISLQRGAFHSEKVLEARALVSPFCENVPDGLQPQAFIDQSPLPPLHVSLSPDGRCMVESPLVRGVEEHILGRVGPGLDGRRRVENPEAKWRYRIHGHLTMTFPNGKTYLGTGTLISPHHVLTAGHNVFSQAIGEGWANSVEFRPARNERLAPFGSAKAITLLSVRNWTEERDERHDFAVVVLDTPIGYRTGWAGLYATEQDEGLRRQVHVTGYPGDKRGEDLGSAQMWTMSHDVQRVDPHRLVYHIDTYAGQSGSGVWTEFDDRSGSYIVGIHTYGGRRENYATRITTEKMQLILKWLEEYQLPNFAHPALIRHEQDEKKRLAGLLAAGGRPAPIVLRGVDDRARAWISEATQRYEAICRRFLNGKLIYRPNAGSDVGMREWQIADLPDPLASSFNLNGCGNAEQKLCISTGYRRDRNLANIEKTEVWICPRFVIERDLRSTASHFRSIMGEWDPVEAPIGTFLTRGNWKELDIYDYATTISWDNYRVSNCYDLWYASGPPGVKRFFSTRRKVNTDELDKFKFFFPDI